MVEIKKDQKVISRSKNARNILDYRRVSPVDVCCAIYEGNKAVAYVGFVNGAGSVITFNSSVVAKNWLGKLFASHLEKIQDDNMAVVWRAKS